MRIFWSYARRDNSHPKYKITKLKEAFETVLSQVTGKDCEVYFDQISLGWGVEWKKEIDRLIEQSDALVAVVSPSYFNSRMCMYELKKAKDSGKRILPLYYRTCKTFRSTFKEDGVDAESNKKLNEASLSISEIQIKDFRALRNEKVTSKRVENFLDSLAEELA